ncbi:ABC transporter ATP-binding protein [Enemella dayhoffiae]|uniref:ABC transporter ATP-binding protein n=1 Tax=Enemella dayhoffiae TaxID=2016507 RepID=A0A255GL78_9ACTN|nr:ATP-binding cassette domain-containing protein [Enemella dayhoffiae]OYO16569.1 ABC transporter ATP-binding protein [Enemella dayhoffiae]
MTEGTGGLTVSGLGVRYGRATALASVDLVAPAGAVTAVIGPNGAGKSSLALGLYGSIPASGTVTLGGRELSGRPALARARAGMALVPQGRQLFPRMTVRENIEVMASLLKIPRAEVDSALDRFPILRERISSYAGVLSGGEQQMLVVTRALMARPRAIVLDEMMTGLAPRIVAELRQTVAGLAADGVAVLVTDPSLAGLRAVVDRGYVLVRGRVVAEAEDAETLDRAYQRAMGVIVDEIEHGIEEEDSQHG